MILFRWIKVLKYLIAIIFLITGVVGLFGGEITGNDNNFSVLTTPSGIAVNKDGNVFCGIIHRSRVNIYDMNGAFINSISINADGGDFRIKLDNDKLLVATSRNNRLYTFDGNGVLIQQEENKQSYESFGQANEKQFIDNKNNVYRIKNILLIYPYIQKITPLGEEKTIVTVPFEKWIFMTPMPAWLFMFLGLLLLSHDLNRLRKRFKEEVEDQ